MTRRIRPVDGLVINGVDVRPRRLPPWVTFFVPAFLRLIGAAVFEIRASRAAKHLAMMDDRTLRDIGVGRGEIGRIVRYGRRYPSEG